MVSCVSYVQAPVTIQNNPVRKVQFGRQSWSTISGKPAFTRPSHSRNYACVTIHPANPIIARVGYIDVAGLIDSHPSGIVEPRLGGKPAIAGKTAAVWSDGEKGIRNNKEAQTSQQPSANHSGTHRRLRLPEVKRTELLFLSVTLLLDAENGQGIFAQRTPSHLYLDCGGYQWR
jgi:hypothetical protein